MHQGSTIQTSSLLTTRRGSMVKVGGALGIAGSCIALAVFVAACFRLDAALMFSPLPVLFGAVGAILSIVGAVTRTHSGDEETQPIAALFACAVSLLLGLFEMHVWWHTTGTFWAAS